MARKRASRSSGDSTSPNRVLVVFLVMFILATLGLGAWVYSIFGERRKHEETAIKAKAEVTAARETEAWWKLQALEVRAMLGDPAFRDDKTEEHQAWKALRDEFVEPGLEPTIKAEGKFKGEKEKESLKKWIETAAKDLKWNPQTYTYGTSYRDEVKQYRDEAKKYRETAFAMLTQKKAAEERERSLDSKYAADRKAQFAEIKAFGNKGLQAVQASSQTMTDALAANEKLGLQIKEVAAKAAKDLSIKDAMIRELKDKVALGGGGTEKTAKGPAAGEVQAHALFLDISKGKPLWDRPRGKIIRIDEKERKVYLDRGANDGASVGLSFNVFGAGWGSRAEGPFKGTVEVVRVEARTSVARITSLYDAHGDEISLNDPSPNKLLREGNNALKEGDLLFNLAWGTHVAVAGAVDWTGRGAQAAAAQMEEMEEFMRVLRSQGVTVDAFVDLRDGQVRGRLTPKTAFLVRGLGAWGDKSEDARLKAVNEAVDTLRKTAIDRGLFLISPDNLINVVGYRRPRSRTDTELTGFRPSLPAGGPLLAGSIAGVEGGKAGDAAIAELTGKWGGKLSGGGLLRLSFKGDGGCVWQVVAGAEKLTGYANVTQSGKDLTVVIQARPATLRLVNAGQSLQVSGAQLEATLTKE